MRQTCLFAALLPILLITVASSPDPKAPATSAQIVAGAEKEVKLLVYSTTDSASAAPLLKDFGAAYPKIALEYSDMNSTEVYNRFVAEAAAGAGSADLLWSSAMDLQIKLANDGYAAEYQSPEAAQLPKWAVWKGQAFGTTFEPIGLVYNKRLLKPEET